MLTTLFIRLPARATFDSALPECRFALVSGQDRIERQGTQQLSGLAEHIGAAARVVLILAAADVNLLQMQVPPLSDAKLKLALPHLVEEQLLADPLDCVFVAGRAAGNMRLIAVVHRDWLEWLVKTLLALGAHNLQALPAQLCLPLHGPDTAVAAISEHGSAIDVALRMSAQQGIGWSPAPLSGQSAAQEVLTGLTAIWPQQPLTLYVPASSRAAYQEPGLAQVTVQVDDWSHWIAGAQELVRIGSVDLMGGLTAHAAGTEFSWRRWRWPLGLAVALLLVNILSLNVDWWRMRREAGGIRAGMLQSYRAAYPNETVIVDPVAQMKQKIALAERDSGQLAADDFIALAAGFGAAWSAQPADKGAIAALEYRDHQLLVRAHNPADAADAPVKRVLAEQHLTLTKSATGVWQIGSRQ